MSRSTLHFLAQLLFAAAFFATNTPQIYATSGIDPSWATSLAMAFSQKETFGVDFIFNYGPLGFLNTLVLPQNVSVWWPVIFHCFILWNFLFILRAAYSKANSLWVYAIGLLILLPWGFIADSSFTLLFLLLFWLLYWYQNPRSWWPLLLLPLLVNEIFFIKLNLSLVAYVVLISSLFYFVWSKKVFILWPFSVLVSTAVTTLVFSKILGVKIGSYLMSGTKIIDAYQDAMAVQLVSGKELYILLGFMALALCFVLFFIIRQRTSFKNHLFLYLLIALAFFLSFKQAFTATGHYNIFGFFLLLPPLAVLIYLFHEKAKGSLVWGILAIQLAATQYIRASYNEFSLQNYLLFAFPAEAVEQYHAKSSKKELLKVLKYKNPFGYFQKALNYRFEHNFTQKNLPLLPENIKNKIGSGTVDVVPWESSIVFFNRLNYAHRPVIQSYQANSHWLEQKNEAFYFSENAPQWVFASVEDFREQNPYWMDKGVHLALKENYKLTDTLRLQTGTHFLFKKVKQFAAPQWQELNSGEAQMGQALDVIQPHSYFSAKVSYSFAGKIARLFFQPPYLRIRVVYKSGEKAMYRVPPPILEGGIFMGNKATNQEEFLLFHSLQEGVNNPIEKVEMFSNSPWGFVESFTYSFFTNK